MRTAGWLLLAGGSLATFGAFMPPYKQWYSPLENGLRVIHANPIGWYAIHAGFLSGTWVSCAGLAVLAYALRDRPGEQWAIVMSVVYTLAAVCWTVNIGYRVTVWNWAAERFVTTGIIPSEFVAWQRFAGIMVACFSVGAYLVVAGLGALSLASAAVSRTLAWVFVVWGLSAGFIVGYNVPFIAYVPFILFGVFVLRGS